MGCSAAIGEPALGAYNDPAVTILTGDANNRPASYTGPLQYGSPSVANVGSQLTMLSTVGGLENLASTVTLVAGNNNNVYGNNPASILRPGTNAVPQINVVNGDLTLGGGWTGAGILLVTGNLTFQGNPSYNGLILVIGKGSVVKNGGGNGTVNGSMLVANLHDSSGALLPASSAPGVPNFNWNGGGDGFLELRQLLVQHDEQPASLPHRGCAGDDVLNDPSISRNLTMPQSSIFEDWGFSF